jgi:hypothetical protein
MKPPSLHADVKVVALSEHRQHLPLLQAWFEAEWPAYYGPEGPGDAKADLRAYADAEDLPLGLIALSGDQPCGLAALKDETFANHQHLGPWVGAGYVLPELRGRGIGARLRVGWGDISAYFFGQMQAFRVWNQMLKDSSGADHLAFLYSGGAAVLMHADIDAGGGWGRIHLYGLAMSSFLRLNG